jgi:hypothetical protein
MLSASLKHRASLKHWVWWSSVAETTMHQSRAETTTPCSGFDSYRNMENHRIFFESLNHITTFAQFIETTLFQIVRQDLQDLQDLLFL